MVLVFTDQRINLSLTFLLANSNLSGTILILAYHASKLGLTCISLHLQAIYAISMIYIHNALSGYVIETLNWILYVIFITYPDSAL